MLANFFDKYKGARRLALLWSILLITFVVVRVTDKDVLLHITPSGATVVTAIIGILTTVIAFYQWDRARDDK